MYPGKTRGKTQQKSSREDLYYEALYNHEPTPSTANPIQRTRLGKTPSLERQRQSQKVR